jgi:hypothetical protein
VQMAAELILSCARRTENGNSNPRYNWNDVAYE